MPGDGGDVDRPVDGGGTLPVFESGDVACANAWDDDADGTTDCDDVDCASSVPCAPRLRPAGTPDFLIFAVSGHCDPTTCGTGANIEYLFREGTVEAVAAPMADRGFVVHAFLAVDGFYDDPPGSADPASFGFLSLLAEMRSARDTLVAGWDNPTRIIVLAHSHGTVWAHLALHVLEQEGNPLPVDILIDLDAVSDGWEDKIALGFGDAWGAVLQNYTTSTGTVWPFAVWDPADAWTVAGSSVVRDIEDIVPLSAVANLEVWSMDGTFIRDTDFNVRVDGTTTNFAFFHAAENHGGTVSPTSSSIRWVQENIVAAYGW